MKDPDISQGKRKQQKKQNLEPKLKKKRLHLNNNVEKVTTTDSTILNDEPKEEMETTNKFVFGTDFTTIEKSTTPPLKTYVGPWKDVEEFKHVYQLLYGEDSNLDTCNEALYQLEIWKLRRSTLCPAGVLATHILLQVVLKDEAYTKEAQKTDRYIDDDLQSLYAFAIIRFYNFMSSTVQEHKMRSMYDTAKLLEINSFVVDIRHLCSHGQVLPDLTMLRFVASYCLKWIKGHYWLPLVNNMRNVTAEDIISPIMQQLITKLEMLLKLFDSAFLCFVHDASDIQNARSILKGTRYALLKTYSKEFHLFKLRDIINSLVSQLSELFHNARNQSPDDAQEIDNLYIDGLLKLKHFYKFPYKQNADSGFAKLYDSVQSLFRMLSVNDLLKPYFMGLMRVAEATQRFGPEHFCGAAFWANKLVEGFETYKLWREKVFETDSENLYTAKYAFSQTNFSEVPKYVRALLESQGINTRFKLIFGYADRILWDMLFIRQYVKERLHNINIYTENIVKSLLSLTKPALSSELKANLLKLIEYQLTMEPNGTKKNIQAIEETPIYTAANLMAIKFGKVANFADKSIDENNLNSQNKIWWKATENEVIDWSVTPLGKTPWELS